MVTENMVFTKTSFEKSKWNVLNVLVIQYVCIPILITMFPEWLSGTEPLPHTPGAVRPSSLCL